MVEIVYITTILHRIINTFHSLQKTSFYYSAVEWLNSDVQNSKKYLQVHVLTLKMTKKLAKMGT
jgi:hypothetical protein